jgi:ATP/maltotriose-dependent transcriptional regulator MalT
MTKDLNQLFNFEGMALCIASSDKQVLFQNDSCKSICGEKIDKFCNKCNDDSNKLSHKMRNIIKYIENNKKFTLFYPSKNKLSHYKDFFKDRHFTKREIEIANFIIEKDSNQDILNKLKISKPTLKTHLNHLYKKAPELKSFRLESN